MTMLKKLSVEDVAIVFSVAMLFGLLAGYYTSEWVTQDMKGQCHDAIDQCLMLYEQCNPIGEEWYNAINITQIKRDVSGQD